MSSIHFFSENSVGGDIQWAFTQVKGTLEDDYTDGKNMDKVVKEPQETDVNNLSADLISCVEFNSNGNLLACGDKGGRIVIFQRNVSSSMIRIWW